jgi:hypothetical protein
VVDGLNNARAVVEDAPAVAFSRPYERHQIAAVLKAAFEDAARAGREARELSGLWA